MFNKITFLLCCCLFFSACFSKSENALEINFSTDSTKVVFEGIEQANLYQLKRNLNDSISTSLVSVVDLVEAKLGGDKLVAGKLIVDRDVVYFVPEQPFKKGHSYWINTVLNASFATKQDILKSDVGHNVKPQEKILKR
jgi:hypothetical protein